MYPMAPGVSKTTEQCNNMPENCKKGFLEAKPGQFSAGRLMSFLALLAGIGLGYLAIIKGSELGAVVSSTFVVAAFGGHVAQKSVEEKRS